VEKRHLSHPAQDGRVARALVLKVITECCRRLPRRRSRPLSAAALRKRQICRVWRSAALQAHRPLLMPLHDRRRTCHRWRGFKLRPKHRSHPILA
jgi:hypothetical protein